MDHSRRSVDMARPSKSTKQALLQHAYAKETDEGLGFMARVRARMDRAGLPQATVEVRFRNLAVQGRQVVVSSSGSSGTIRFLSTILSMTGIPPPGSRMVPILEGVSGVLKPGRLTLLLGHPGSGKTVLLKALAGQLRGNPSLKVTADELSYNGRDLLRGPGGRAPDFVPERTAVFIPPLEAHFGELTVRQTLEFAARVHGGMFAEELPELEALETELGIQPDPAIASVMAALAADSHNSLVVDVLLRTLGMDECADTLVGSVMLRGISGGQRKRLTTGEALTASFRLLLGDEISTGLDSATTHAIVSSLRSISRSLQVTQLLALLQPPPETAALFDDVMLLSAGRLVFHGPCELLQPFFQGGLGFRCPIRKTMAEVVQELASAAGQERYWDAQRGPFKFLPAADIAHAFYGSTGAGKAIQEDLSKPYGQDGMDAPALSTRRYGARPLVQLRACLARGLLLQRGQSLLIIGRILNNIILGVCAGTLFLNEPKGLQGGDLQGVVQSISAIIGVCFFSLTNSILTCFADSAVFVAALPVFYKHKAGRYYPAVCFALPFVLLRLPWLFVECWIWTAIVYFAVGLAATVARVFVFWAVLFALGVFITTLFLATAAGARSIPGTVAVEAGFVMVFTATMGVILTGTDIPSVWKAAYWANPVQFCMSALAINEFTSADWAQQLGPGTTLGQTALNIRGFPTSYAVVWVAIFVVGIGCSLLNFSVMVLFLAKLGGLREPVFVTEDAVKQRQVLSSGSAKDTAITVEVAPPSDSRRHPSLASTVDLDKEGSSKEAQASMVLPFTPLAMTFRDVQYSVPFGGDLEPDPTSTNDPTSPHAGRLLLLRGISGTFRPGVLSALMGASGAGKTTLMDVLVGRKTGGVITGDILVNGQPKQDATLPRLSGYCEQQDIHAPYTTVHEACLLSARLRLPAHLSRQVVDAFVLEQMRLVELEGIANRLVGLPGSHLSTEQRKRLTIAVELVSNPSIIFMDEPTTGLDARAAAMVMRAVKNASGTGRTVVCTIHQPSLDVYEAFDELLLLQRGGRTIFNGPTSALIPYFQAISGVPPIEAGVNPANWMLEITSAEAEKKTGANFAAAFQGSALAHEAQAVLEQWSCWVCSQPTGEGLLGAADVQVAGWMRQTWELTVRNFREYNRNLLYSVIRGAIMLAVAVVFATLFIGQGSRYDTFAGVLNIVGAMYSCCMFCGLTVCYLVQDVVSVRRTVFYRERAAKMYGCLPFFLAESAVELPWLMAKTLCFSVIVYFGIGFISSAAKFWFFTLALTLIYLMFTYFGMLLVHLTPSLELANAATALTFMLLTLFCGFLKTKPTFPRGWLWMYWLDPASYGLWGLATSQLGDITHVSIAVQPGMPTITVAEFIETYFGFTRSFMWCTVAILVAFILGFRLISLLAISRLTFQRR